MWVAEQEGLLRAVRHRQALREARQWQGGSSGSSVCRCVGSGVAAAALLRKKVAQVAMLRAVCVKSLAFNAYNRSKTVYNRQNGGMRVQGKHVQKGGQQAVKRAPANKEAQHKQHQPRCLEGV